LVKTTKHDVTVEPVVELPEETKSPRFNEQAPTNNVKIIEIMHSARAITDKKIALMSPRLGKSIRIRSSGRRQQSTNPKGLVKTAKNEEHKNFE